jgi:hypothetical protein
MKTSSIFCLIAMGMLVSIIQHASSKDPAPFSHFCHKLICGKECFYSRTKYVCYCNGPCTDTETTFVYLATNFNSAISRQMVERGISYNPQFNNTIEYTNYRYYKDCRLWSFQTIYTNFLCQINLY